MSTKKIKIIVLCIICIFLSHPLLADDKIKIKLHQPPPNKLGAADLWKLDITNTTREDIAIYLSGTATEEKDGLIVDGKSKVFIVKPGKKTFGYNDFKEGDVNWRNKTSQEAILRTGNVKSGTYTICVTAFYENGSVADNEQCITQVIENKSTAMILPVSPADKEEIDPDTLPGITFSWTGIGVSGPYDLRIVEIRGHEVPPDPIAFKEKRPLYEQKGIKGNSFQYPVTGPKFEAGKKYAWGIEAGETLSDIYTFYVSSQGDSVRLIISPIDCQGCCFNLSVTGSSNINWNAFKLTSGSNNITSVAPAGGMSIVSQTTGDVVIKKNSGTFINGANVGIICFNQVPGAFPVSIMWSTNGGTAFVMPADQQYLQCPPPCPENTLCDSLNATASAAQGNCCRQINLSHPQNTAGIKGIQFLPLSPNTFTSASLESGYTAGWMYQVNNSTEFKIKRASGYVPPGQLNGFFNFCLNNLSSPQYIIVNWLSDSGSVICSDTVTVNCDIPCVSYTKDTIECNGSNYNWIYSFTNNSGFPISSVTYTIQSPSGAVITPGVTTLTTPVNSGQNSGNITLGLSGVGQNTTVCVVMKFLSTDSCCWCYDTLCVTTPSCICDKVDASVTGDPYSCCYDLSLINNYAANYFTQVNLTCISSGVTMSTFSFNGNWGSLNVFPSNQAQVAESSGYIPLGTSANIGNFCFTGYTATPQYILVEWIRNDTVKCVDTLITNCVPPEQKHDSCSQIINDTIICLPDGTFQYTFQVQNNSIHNATGFQLNPVSPTGLILNPNNFPSVSIPAGTVSPPQSLIISGIGQNTPFCFEIALYEHVGNTYSWCCHSDTVCLTTPSCGGGSGCNCEDGILNNWNLSQGLATGNLAPSGTGQMTSWQSYYGTPQVQTANGCCDPGFIHFWGHQTNGEGFSQTGLTITNGTKYKISVCTRLSPINSGSETYGRIRVSFSNGVPTTYPGGIQAGIIGDVSTVTVPAIASPGITSTAWTTYSFEWTANANYNTINFNPTNNNSGGPGTVSWMQIDNICLEVIPDSTLPCQIAKGIDSLQCGPMVPFGSGMVQSYTFNLTVTSNMNGWLQTMTSPYYWYSNSGNTVNTGTNTYNCTFLNTTNLPPGTQVCLAGGVMRSTAPYDTCYFNVCFDIPGCNDSCYLQMLGSPNQGDTLCTGQAVTINWTGYTPGGLVNLSFIDVNGWIVNQAVATSIPNTGSYNWIIPSNISCDSVKRWQFYVEDINKKCWSYGPVFYIKCCDSSCGCGEWMGNKVITIHGFNGNLNEEIETPVPCGKTYNDIFAGTTLDLVGTQYICTGNNCNTAYNWSITSPSNIVTAFNGLVINNFLFNETGTYSVNMTVSCGGKVCDSCLIFINVIEPNDSCKCNDSASFTVNYGNGTKGRVKCNETIIAAYQSALTFTPQNLCLPKECAKGYTYEIHDLQTNAYVTGQSMLSMAPFTVTLNSYAGYVITVTYNCNGVKCKCVFYIKTKPTGHGCDCGEWKQEFSGVTIDKQPVYKAECGGTITADVNSNILVNFPSYICKPDTCRAKYTWALAGGPGISETGTGNSFNYTFNSPGTYNLSLNAYCGGKLCDSCSYTIIIKGGDTCTCNKWNGNAGTVTYPAANGNVTSNMNCSGDIQGAVTGNFVFNFNPACLPPGACNADFKVQFQNGIGTVMQEVTGTSPITVTVNTSLYYRVKLFSYCDGVLCDTCSFTMYVAPKPQGCIEVTKDSVWCINKTGNNWNYGFKLWINNVSGSVCNTLNIVPNIAGSGNMTGGFSTNNVPVGTSMITGSFTDFAPVNNPFCLKLICQKNPACNSVHCLSLPVCQ